MPWLVIKHPLALGYLIIKCQYLSSVFSKLPMQKSLFFMVQRRPYGFHSWLSASPLLSFVFYFSSGSFMKSPNSHPGLLSLLLFLPKFSNGWNTVIKECMCSHTYNNIPIHDQWESEQLDHHSTQGQNVLPLTPLMESSLPVKRWGMHLQHPIFLPAV